MSLIKEFEKEEMDHSFQENTEEEEDKVTIIVSGLKPTAQAKETVWYYFENSRRSGGGEVLNVDFNEQGDAVVTFQAVKGIYLSLIHI